MKCQGVLAIHLQIFNRVSEGIINPLQIPRSILASFANNTNLPQGCQYPLIMCGKGANPLERLPEDIV
jgi:hypothetical protein